MFYAHVVVHYQQLPDYVLLPDGALTMKAHAGRLASHVQAYFSSEVLGPCASMEPELFETNIRIHELPVTGYTASGPRMRLSGSIPPFCRAGFNARLESYLERWLAAQGPLRKKIASLCDEEGTLRLAYGFVFADGCFGRLVQRQDET